MCAGKVRCQFQRLAVVNDRFVVAPEIGQHARQIVVRLRIGPVGPDGLSQKLDARVAVARVMRQQPEIAKRIGMARIGGENFAIAGLGLAKLSGLMMADRLLQQHFLQRIRNTRSGGGTGLAVGAALFSVHDFNLKKTAMDCADTRA